MRRSSWAEWATAVVGQHDAAFCASSGAPESTLDGRWGSRGHRYRRFADLQGWKVDRVSENEAESGGYKECILQAPPPPPNPSRALLPRLALHTIGLCWPAACSTSSPHCLS